MDRAPADTSGQVLCPVWHHVRSQLLLSNSTSPLMLFNNSSSRNLPNFRYGSSPGPRAYDPGETGRVIDLCRPLVIDWAQADLLRILMASQELLILQSWCCKASKCPKDGQACLTD